MRIVDQPWPHDCTFKEVCVPVPKPSANAMPYTNCIACASCTSGASSHIVWYEWLSPISHNRRNRLTSIQPSTLKGAAAVISVWPVLNNSGAIIFQPQFPATVAHTGMHTRILMSNTFWLPWPRLIIILRVSMIHQSKASQTPTLHY